jgi:hypothetical protein
MIFSGTREYHQAIYIASNIIAYHFQTVFLMGFSQNAYIKQTINLLHYLQPFSQLEDFTMTSSIRNEKTQDSEQDLGELIK